MNNSIRVRTRLTDYSGCRSDGLFEAIALDGIGDFSIFLAGVPICEQEIKIQKAIR